MSSLPSTSQLPLFAYVASLIFILDYVPALMDLATAFFFLGCERHLEYVHPQVSSNTKMPDNIIFAV
ncbi:dna polymerase beta [Moniliophthora roreri]|nr:dna polymerase beta [Moniliophthora roreri]